MEVILTREGSQTKSFKEVKLVTQSHSNMWSYSCVVILTSEDKSWKDILTSEGSHTKSF